MNKIRHAFFIISLFLVNPVFSQNVVIVIIDGARYSETFADQNNSYTPKMWDLAKGGTYINDFYNDSTTYTAAAIPALWCGTWTDRVDTFYNGANTQYAVKPSIFEYFRKQKNIAEEKCLYSLKYVSSLWLQSFHKDYGVNYWPHTISQGWNDDDVLQNTLNYMQLEHPQLTVMYLAGVDGAGHTGNWNNYVNTLENADKIVADFWETIQQDDFYKEKTTMIVTNDHGRHDDAHGGFQGHGCGCSGCRRIMFLAVGPNIKKNYVSTQTRRIPDVAVTAASILGVNMEYSSGEVTTEIFESTEISKLNNSISWLVTPSEIRVNIQNKSKISLSVYNITGKKVKEIANNLEVSHHQNFNWNNNLNEGIYFIRLMIDGIKETKKVVVLN
ncbi:MAG: sulfatase-like hydrolase/transferase [Prolixibacteraceae bacterium]|jgi:hypothetical protein|nr:sulfatase-like hydrolase/transferase [Prolixibacteraceae bacterium]MBT6764863.1 sulfatase-like hydrolase/transferase [Prolixibacteraceae bacterium]MBT6997105.1 sulfatase-like hydrolase/transferase [Prolixibacteraceae bacterium]MBT7393362.1 sulfatase-like hydrolase/transferase [Prolixibacteraceae bacterium]